MFNIIFFFIQYRLYYNKFLDFELKTIKIILRLSIAVSTFENNDVNILMYKLGYFVYTFR